jgi:hypothetical protein
LDSSSRTWDESLLFTTLVHELGHALGVDHIDGKLSIMNATLGGDNVLPAIDDGYLFPPEIAAIQDRWGRGTGEVIAPRHWVGGGTMRWSDDANWQEGFRPTRHSEVTFDRDGQVTVTGSGNVGRSLTLGGGNNELRVPAAGKLQLEHDVILGSAQGGTTLVALGAAAKVHVPANSTDQLGWQDPAFDDSLWQSGATGIGFETESGFETWIQTDLQASMYNRRNSFYARLEFDVADPTQLDFLQLRMLYDDGFVAYLNGTRVATANAPSNVAWNSSAPRSREDDEALQFEAFDLSDWLSALQSGRNVLAIQGLNNRSNSSDLLIDPELHAGPIDNRLVIDRGEMRVGGELRLAETAGSESTVELTSGTLAVRENIVKGAGQGRLEMRGGVLQVEGGDDGRMLVSAGARAAVLVPLDATQDPAWRQPAFDDTAWLAGATGVGYERGAGYQWLIATDLESEMYNRYSSAYVRLPFTWDAGQPDGQLTLRVKFDDGFVAYLNGQEIARANAPTTPRWNSRATDSPDDADAQQFVEFDVTPFASLLVAGDNLLALQGLNSAVDSSDFVLVPELSYRTIAGHLAVDQLDYYGGEIRGAVEVVGIFAHHAGEFSPQHPVVGDEGAGRLRIDGEYRMDADATLRLDRFAQDADGLDVTSLVHLDGTLALVDRRLAAEIDGLARGETERWSLIRAGQIEAAFAQTTLNDLSLVEGHLGDGLFQQLAYRTDEVSLIRYRALPGDGDGDGLFNSNDLLNVFQFGQYEDDIEDNSDWTSGDWTGDLDFNTSDLIEALQTGGYVASAQPVRAVPEPASGAGLVLGCLVILNCERRRRAG